MFESCTKSSKVKSIPRKTKYLQKQHRTGEKTDIAMKCEKFASRNSWLDCVQEILLLIYCKFFPGEHSQLSSFLGNLVFERLQLHLKGIYFFFVLEMGPTLNVCE